MERSLAYMLNEKFNACLLLRGDVASGQGGQMGLTEGCLSHYICDSRRKGALGGARGSTEGPPKCAYNDVYI